MRDATVRRVDFGYFVRPSDETGTGRPRVEPCLGYLLVHPDAMLLFDTGMGNDPDVDDHYRPRRRSLAGALSCAGSHPDQISMVANCHLHFDHCGNNPLLKNRPVFTQAAELNAGRDTPNYTLPQLIDAPGLRYESITGEAEILPGIWLIPTPGHTAGHQSLVVRRSDGTVIVAGQGHETASAYGADVLAWRAARHGHASAPDVPAWIDRLAQFDPARVVFAHDHAIWIP